MAGELAFVPDLGAFLLLDLWRADHRGAAGIERSGVGCCSATQGYGHEDGERRQQQSCRRLPVPPAGVRPRHLVHSLPNFAVTSW